MFKGSIFFSYSTETKCNWVITSSTLDEDKAPCIITHRKEFVTLFCEIYLVLLFAAFLPLLRNYFMPFKITSFKKCFQIDTFLSPVFSLKEQNWRICPYTEKYDSEKTGVLPYFTQCRFTSFRGTMPKKQTCNLTSAILFV